MTLSPEARALIEANEARNRGRQWMRGDSPLFDSRFGARTIGMLAEITVGLTIYSATRTNSDGDPLGGHVVGVDAGWNSTDPETGEIVNHPAQYRCYDPFGRWPDRAFPVLTETEVDRDNVSIPPSGDLVTAIRRFCREVGRHTSGVLDGYDAQLITDAAHLASILMGGR